MTVIIAAAIVAVVGCGGAPSMAELKARHESGLHPPGARLVAHNEHDAERTIDGPVVPIVGDVFAIDAEADTIYAFFETELPKHGYVRDDADLSNIRTTVEQSVRVWRNGNVVARVAVYRIGDTQVPPLPPEMTGGTLFELALIAKPPDLHSARPF